MGEEITLNKVISMLKNKITLIIIVSIIGVLITSIYTFFIVTPKYQSTTQLLVNHTVDDSLGIQLNDINTNVRMIDTYKDILRGPVILEDVREAVDENLSTSQIRDMITINANSNSQVFSLTITSEDPTLSATVANEIANTFQQNIGSIMNVENVSIISEATVNTNPVSPNVMFNLLLGFLAGAMIGIGIVFLQNYLDNTIKGSEFISDNIGWNDLGTISILSEKDKKEIERYLQITNVNISRRNRVI